MIKPKTFLKNTIYIRLLFINLVASVMIFINFLILKNNVLIEETKVYQTIEIIPKPLIIFLVMLVFLIFIYRFLYKKIFYGFIFKANQKKITDIPFKKIFLTLIVVSLQIFIFCYIFAYVGYHKITDLAVLGLVISLCVYVLVSTLQIIYFITNYKISKKIK